MAGFRFLKQGTLLLALPLLMLTGCSAFQKQYHARVAAQAAETAEAASEPVTMVIPVALPRSTPKAIPIDPNKYTTIMPRDTAAPAQQVGRYSTQSATPPNAASEPLQVVATVSYPRATVRTVGDAMNHTLLRTGYRMANDTELTQQAVQFLSLPLPESQRQLGPYTVESILGILLGSPWEIQLQPITRRIQIQLSAAYAGPDAGTSAPTTK